MTQPLLPSADERHYELRYMGLFNSGRGYAFPCNEAGQVDIDRLSAKGRLNYFYARVVVGTELSMPSILRLVA
jgi:hypothetical protein